ncbi:MAG: enoyl-CoA hydratase/isomerase family protein [Alphaproteobacteria bacterium]|uniref:enoyl-CoA hydratase/isomerase family protein n=1 Tax=Maricaulis alexandrii TaxID=2570354 RepID=UPI001109EA7F|nr:enoyl-CoA hydratase/isomerase family protein [Maricaulis alexandrii]MCR9266750.1 enoyl-CoA hydratase/isomerase family protein [Alphaproteobacteria bacterium]
MTEEPEVITRKTGQVGRITLNRPKALNALTHGMCLTMIEALEAWREDDAVQAVVVDGAGEKGFCAGGDILKLHNSGKAGDDQAWLFWRDEYRLNTLIYHYPKPYVALIDGITMGGGVGVSVHGSHRVAGDRTMFAMPETGIGFHPDVGGAFFLPRLAGEIGTWMGLTGARLKAADSVAAGLATHYCPSSQYDELVAALESADLSDEDALEVLLEEFSGDPGDSELGLTRGLIDAAFAGDSFEEIASRIAAAGDSWSAKQAKVMASKSPTALKLTLACLRRGGDLAFEDVMRQDLRVSSWCLKGVDFYEGVRAVIIDKDHAPKWSPAAIGEVDDAWIETAFDTLDDDHEMTFLGE